MKAVRIFPKILSLLMCLLLMAAFGIPMASAQVLEHGAGATKGPGGCKEPGQMTNQTMTARYLDGFGDTLWIVSAKDRITTGGGDVDYPLVGNLPIIAVGGNTTCTVAGALPCKIGPAGSTLSGLPGLPGDGLVQFRSNIYVIQEDDPTTLIDKALIGWEDMCDSPTTQGCSTASQNATGGASTLVCKQDTNLCTTEECNQAGACVSGAVKTCANIDSNLCTDESCVPATGECVSGPAKTCAPDADLCTAEACVPGTGVCTSGPTKTCAPDADLCTTEACIPATGECGTVSTVSCASVGLPDVCCDPEDGVCKADPDLDPSCGREEICRTPGFWCTHECGETGVIGPPCEGKKNSQNITQQVIDYGGPLMICSQTIDKTTLNCSGSALEALCVNIKGASELQLARQLTAAALNCIMSGSGPECDDVSIEEVFQACNTACAAGETTAVVDSETIDCIEAIDCFNNGGSFDLETQFCKIGNCSITGADCDGSCPDVLVDTVITPQQCVPTPGTCHEQALCLDPETPTLCFEPTGPAGSSKASNKAIQNDCTILAPENCECSD